MLVPLKLAYPVPGMQERTLTPGPEMFGLRRLLPSIVTGPRLLKLAMVSVLEVAPTLKEAS
jgi:hypothetical protein